MPPVICKQIKKAMRDFFWEGNSKGPLKHLINWKITSMNIEDGGLGIGGLMRRNNSLLAK